MEFLDRFRPYRPLLWAVALLGLFGLNGVFLYLAFDSPAVVIDALRNPVGLVFVLEAVVLTLFGAWAIGQSELEGPGWLAFLVMTAVGSLAFSVPAFILAHLRKTSDRS